VNGREVAVAEVEVFLHRGNRLMESTHQIRYLLFFKMNHGKG
jgi:hypothetical protein